jgi:hypothetical protein
MKSPKEMEKSLHALMPVALSECCHQRISQKIRALALADEANLGAESATQQSLAAVTLPPVSQVLVSRMPWHTALSSQQEISAPQKKSHIRWPAAAAIAIGSVLAYIYTLSPATPEMAKISSDLNSDDLSVVSSVDTAPVFLDRVQLTDALADEGTLTSADGSMLQQWKRRVQTRERYRDANTGYLITISESRDEKVLVPKTSF